MSFAWRLTHINLLSIECTLIPDGLLAMTNEVRSVDGAQRPSDQTESVLELRHGDWAAYTCGRIRYAYDICRFLFLLLPDFLARFDNTPLTRDYLNCLQKSLKNLTSRSRVIFATATNVLS